MGNSETLTLRKQNLYQRNNWLDVQSAHLSDILYGITDIERKWRTAMLKSDISEMSRLLKENPELVNWQDYITGTALHFAAKANDMIIVKLLAGTNKANVELRNHRESIPEPPLREVHILLLHVLTCVINHLYHRMCVESFDLETSKLTDTRLYRTWGFEFSIVIVSFYNDVGIYSRNSLPTSLYSKECYANFIGLVPLHMAAIGASEEVAFELMSRFGAKATIRDYSGRLPVSYLPDTDAGRRLKISKLVIESQPVLLSHSAHPTTPTISQLPPMVPLNSIPPSAAAEHVDSKSSNQPMKPSAVKHGKFFACGSFRRKPSIRKERNASTAGCSELDDNQIISRDDLPPMTPTRITDFPTLARRSSVSRPGLGASEYSRMVYSTIQRRKAERGKNYNPTNPENQQVGAANFTNQYSN
ncbi:hypothetical protein ACTXT7_009695 [Hymenolepis weldensis]